MRWAQVGCFVKLLAWELGFAVGFSDYDRAYSLRWVLDGPGLRRIPWDWRFGGVPLWAASSGWGAWRRTKVER